MIKRIVNVVGWSGLLLCFSSFANDYADTIQTFRSSKVVQPYFANAYGYAVFPSIGKGGIGVGGAYGEGLFIIHVLWR